MILSILAELYIPREVQDVCYALATHGEKYSKNFLKYYSSTAWWRSAIGYWVVGDQKTFSTDEKLPEMDCGLVPEQSPTSCRPVASHLTSTWRLLAVKLAS